MNMQSNNDKTLSDIIEELRMKMSELDIKAENGIGDDLFILVSSLSPIVNVDLLVYNSKGQFLLSRRNDPHSGSGWHVPGGCVRFKESMEDRIRIVANQELNLFDFTYDKTPLKVFEIICRDPREIDVQDERAHFITMVFKCKAPDTYNIDNGEKSENDIGFIKWHDKLPEDFLMIQSCYREILK